MHNDLLRVLDMLGVVVMGITGGALASRLNFDAVGFAVIGIVSGLGGGILRDLILGVPVPAAFDGPWYLVCALGGALFSYLVRTESRHWDRALLLLDALAMGLWAATGTAKSIGMGLDPLPAILLGVLSAVGGGAMRDLMLGRIPAIFGGNALYATNALVTAVTTWGVLALRLPGWSVLGPVLLGSGLAVVSAWRGWGLPRHQQWQVTLSPSQLRSLVRRVRRSERRRVELETGAIPSVPPEDWEPDKQAWDAGVDMPEPEHPEADDDPPDPTGEDDPPRT